MRSFWAGNAAGRVLVDPVDQDGHHQVQGQDQHKDQDEAGDSVLQGDDNRQQRTHDAVQQGYNRLDYISKHMGFLPLKFNFRGPDAPLQLS